MKKTGPVGRSGGELMIKVSMGSFFLSKNYGTFAAIYIQGVVVAGVPIISH